MKWLFTKLAGVAIVCLFLAGCAGGPFSAVTTPYQLHKPVDGTMFLNLSNNIKTTLIDAQIAIDPTLSNEEAEAKAKELFNLDKESFMIEYRRANAITSLVSRFASIIAGEPVSDVANASEP